MSKSHDPTNSELVECGAEVLRGEANSLLHLAEHLGENFALAVRLIHELRESGRVVTSGMGKAGIIAGKVSATFASVGRSSFFLHPAEAIHGDLGRLTSGDLALIFSYSGETDEVLRMLSPLKGLGSSVISITKNASTPLGSHSDICLELGEIAEAGPLGLAPTTTAAAMLGIGDALAMSYLKLQNFSPEEFAYFHPGGKLGRALMKVGELMRTGEEHCVVSDSLTTAEVLKSIAATPKRPGAASIVDSEGKLVGVFTDGDLRRLLAEERDFLSRPVSESMGKSPKTISSDQLVSEALRILSKFKIDQLVVVDNQGKPLGMLDIQDTVVTFA